MKRPPSLTLLCILLGWTAYEAASSLFWYRTSSQFLFLEKLDLALLHFGLSAGTVVFAGYACVAVWWLLPDGFAVALGTLAFIALGDLGISYLMAQHLDIAGQAYEASRAARGLPVRPENVSRMFTPGGIQFVALASLGISAVGVLLLVFGRRSVNAQAG